MRAYRVFISYSHADLELATRIADYLRNDLKMIPLSDQSFAAGHKFHEQIKAYIAHAHVFLPIITASSSKRGWVHQEIGYAMALNVPVLPIALGAKVGEMMQQLQAITLDGPNANLSKLQAAHFARLVETPYDPAAALYTCADEHEDRARMMHDHADAIRRLGYPGEVRQRSGLSSFHIPNKTVRHPAWKARYHPKKPRGEYHCRLQQNERAALEWHVKNAEKTSKLIIRPEVEFKEHGPNARIARLVELVEFLESEAGAKVEVAHGSLREQGENVTIVGDWFVATSIIGLPDIGYRQTVFSRHAPTVRNRIALFDQEFAECQPWPGTSPSSRVRAIAYLKRLIASLGGKSRRGGKSKRRLPPKS